MGWTRLVNDAVVTTSPAILHRIVPDASSDGGDVKLYDGQDTSGRFIGTFVGLANQNLTVELQVECPNGIYVDIGSNLTACLVVWTPLPEPQ